VLSAAVAGALALVLPVRPRAGSGFRLASVAAARPKPFGSRLPIPKLLTGANLRIEMREARVGILPGKKTAMWTFDGTFPGPTIRRPTGEPTKVTFAHRLPRKAGDLTVHLHGGHNTSRDDGQPGGLTRSHRRSLYCEIPSELSARESGNDLLIRRGGQRTYTYELTEDGAPERAAFQWYHDHRLDRTARNVWHGLAGM
jgi:FtsP/CotA-like multicopper oxidase with cupredoxin domain